MCSKLSNCRYIKNDAHAFFENVNEDMLWTLEIDMCCDLKKEQNDEHIKQYAELFLSLSSQGFILTTLDKEKDISLNK